MAAKKKLWKQRVRELYGSVEVLRAYFNTYGFAKRLGYKSAAALWRDNPILTGSTDPSEFRVFTPRSSESKPAVTLESVQTELAQYFLKNWTGAQRHDVVTVRTIVQKAWAAAKRSRAA
jgi:hypothetical protein